MDEFSHLKSKLLAEQVEEQIYHYILDTPLNPGSKLPNEFELGEKFGVGRSTIREAVKLLSSKGIVLRHLCADDGAGHGGPVGVKLGSGQNRVGAGPCQCASATGTWHCRDGRQQRDG